MAPNKIRISEAAKILGVSAQTLRNWDKSGKLKPERSTGKQRYYPLEEIKKFAIDIEGLGLVWATSAIPPELPSEYYCERPDRFTSRIAKMGLELQQDKSNPETLDSLITLITGEIGDNSFAHNTGNWPDTPGIFYAYDLRKRIIVIADRGRGVKMTLHQVRPSISTDVEALKVAFTEIVSGRNPERRGNGLKVVLSAVESNPIGLLLQSGIGVANVAIKKPGFLRIGMAAQNIRGSYGVIRF
jgi:hypothetical protein